jgi:FKBP-type peptidyl-prolyl cis-trans isomerase
MSFSEKILSGALRVMGRSAIVLVVTASGLSIGSGWAQDREKKPATDIPLAKPNIQLSPADKPAASVVAPAKADTAGTVAATAKPNLSIVRPATVVTAGRIASTPSGVKFEDLVIGSGAVAARGQTVRVHYTGWLVDGKTLGKKFDSSLDRNQSFSFKLGEGRVIKGWDEGIAGMKVGGTRVLTVPPEAAYGQKAVGTAIPAGSTLVFEVRLLAN